MLGKTLRMCMAHMVSYMIFSWGEYRCMLSVHVRPRDTPDASGSGASAVRGKEVGCFRKVAGVSIVAAGGLRYTLLTVDSRVA